LKVCDKENSRFGVSDDLINLFYENPADRKKYYAFCVPVCWIPTNFLSSV